MERFLERGQGDLLERGIRARREESKDVVLVVGASLQEHKKHILGISFIILPSFVCEQQSSVVQCLAACLTHSKYSFTFND